VLYPLSYEGIVPICRDLSLRWYGKGYHKLLMSCQVCGECARKAVESASDARSETCTVPVTIHASSLAAAVVRLPWPTSTGRMLRRMRPHGMRVIRVLPVSVLLALVCLSLIACGRTSAATPRAEAGATLHLSGYSHGDGPRVTVILTGVIGDFGTGVYVHPDGTVDPEHAAELQLNLTQGSFRISVAHLDKQLVAAFGRAEFNRSTGSGHVSVTDTTPIVGGSGTGSYSGISGSFLLTVTIDEIVKKPATSPSGATRAQVNIMTGSGIVSLP